MSITIQDVNDQIKALGLDGAARQHTDRVQAVLLTKLSLNIQEQTQALNQLVNIVTEMQNTNTRLTDIITELQNIVTKLNQIKNKLDD